MQDYDAWMNPDTHHLQQTIYLARRNPNPVDDTDLYEIISASKPEDVIDPEEGKLCKLAPYEQIPTVDG